MVKTLSKILQNLVLFFNLYWILLSFVSSSPSESSKQAKDKPSTSHNKPASLSDLGKRIEHRIQSVKMPKREAQNFRYHNMVHFGSQARLARKVAKVKIKQSEAEIKSNKEKHSPLMNSVLSNLPFTKENKFRSAFNEKQKQHAQVEDILNDARIMHQKGDLDFDKGFSVFKHVSPHFYNDRYNSDSE